MHLVQTVAELQTQLRLLTSDQKIGLVPTMGALHSGHISLIQRAIAENNLVVVSIFVNPLQFGQNEDLDNYPRQLESDCQICSDLGVNFVFAPPESELYQEKNTTKVVPPESMTSVLCGKFRPGHFEGVATIVTKLFNLVLPHKAYFGEKDAQQVAIIRRIVRDLNIPVEIKACPLVRESSGLAISSRNQYLSREDRNQALSLSRGLFKAKKAFLQGENSQAHLISIVKNELTNIEVEYIELVHPETLQSLTIVKDVGLLAVAAKIGKTRLIDNVMLHRHQPIIAIDGPAGAGKSTVTRKVAQELGLLYLDTGAMYRAITWLVMDKGISCEDENAVAQLITDIELELISNDSQVQVIINGEDITTAIRTPEVTAKVSTISAQKAVREKMVQLQREWGAKGGIIAEGRDLGTYVFPNAELKIFLTASVQERAKRRLKDFENQGKKDINLKQLEQDIQTRDDRDSNRKISPLKKADDAIEIITDNLTVEEVIANIISLYPN